MDIEKALEAVLQGDTYKAWADTLKEKMQAKKWKEPSWKAKRYVSFETAVLAKECGYFDNENWYSGFNPRNGDLIIEGWGWVKRTFNEILDRPSKSDLQEWLRETGVIIDMFYEQGMWSGRVYLLGDPAQRWQSASTSEYENTLEIMLFRGLQFISA